MAKKKEETTDERVLILLRLAQKKKANINITEKAQWLTNCSLSIGSDRINLHVEADISKLIEFYGALKVAKENFDAAAKELNIPKVYKHQGYKAEDWMADIKTRINKIKLKDEKLELETIEAKLEKLISPGKRAELELEAIEKILS